ncbi:efflux RND transporter permease subunit [Sphaerochaeta sp.]|jgi:predicted RND superfamily exporter protein|uniref:efflux RND transporter permease subunit n=1 Tax=Sphaerochaeta sp. TaxID=1972642 RepID=UPI002A3662CE|nr:MMPL family transporter [Sphaerochaeta sp.]MDX9983047.1 MMPL family transporter [Sphaerochaeta sp.]
MKHSLLVFVGKHSKSTLIVILLITAFFLYHAAFLHLDADYNSLMNETGKGVSYQGGSGEHMDQQGSALVEIFIPETMVLDTTALGSHLVASAEVEPPMPEDNLAYSTSYLVMVESPALFEAETLNRITTVMQKLTDTGYLSKSFSVLDFVTFEKKGSRLVTVPLGSSSMQNKWTEEQAQLLKQRIENDPLVKNYLVSENLDAMLFSFESFALTHQMEAELSNLLDELREADITVSINGGAIITNRLMHYLGRDLSILLSLCFIAILTIYYLSFKAKRSVLLPFSMSLIGIIWTFGTMHLLGYSLTIINIVTPCMVLNLGSSYAIHVIGEYYADYAKGLNPIQSTQKILRTIVFACITTVIGFMSLLFSKTPALREFGIAVGIGVSYCAVLASTYLPAMLSLVVPPKQEQIKTYKKGYLAQLVISIDRSVKHAWPLLVVVFLLVIIGYFATRDYIPVNTNYMSYLPKKEPLGETSRRFAQKMGGDTPFLITVEAPEGESQFFLKSGNLQDVYAFEQAVQQSSDDVRHIISFASYVAFANSVYSQEEGIPESDGLLNLLSRMVILMSRQGQEDMGTIMNPEGTKLTIILQNYDAKEQALGTIGSAKRIEDTVISLLPLLPNGTIVTLDGEPHRSLHFSEALLSDQMKSTYASVLLVFLVVLFAFKSVSLALYALIPIISGVMANYIFMYFFQIPFDMITVSFGSIAVGAGIDDAIHFLIRYKNKLGIDDRTVESLLSETIRETGRPIILTTLSIVGGMLMFLFASYTPVRYFGSLMSMALLNCMLSTLLIMPSVIRLVTFFQRKIGMQTNTQRR